MRICAVVLLLSLSFPCLSQEKSESRELVGHIGSRDVYLVLHAGQRADGSWRMTGEYLVLQTMARRYLEGERGPELGVTTLREGTSAILFGRPSTGELRGRLRDGKFSGIRYGPGGQERERFEFSEEFPAMETYAGQVRCEAGEGRYQASLQYAFEAGKPKGAVEWKSSVGASGHRCNVVATEAKPAKGGLRVAAGNCTVMLRELGDYVMVSADNCAAQCGSEAYLEPMLVDRRGNCRLLRPEAR